MQATPSVPAAFVSRRELASELEMRRDDAQSMAAQIERQAEELAWLGRRLVASGDALLTAQSEIRRLRQLLAVTA